MRVRQASRSLKDGLRNTEVDVGHAIAHGADDGENEGSHEGRNRGAQGRAVGLWWLIRPSSGCTTQGHSCFEGISREDCETPRGALQIFSWRSAMKRGLRLLAFS